MSKLRLCLRHEFTGLLTRHEKPIPNKAFVTQFCVFGDFAFGFEQAINYALFVLQKRTPTCTNGLASHTVHFGPSSGTSLR